VDIGGIEEGAIMDKLKCKLKVKEVCLKCESVLSQYKNKQGKVYPVLCGDCVKKVKELCKDILKPHYWTNCPHQKRSVRDGKIK